ncbi:MAG: class I SAM-dependent methyltransferase [Magnetococcales bacterium]|nr:class I SAM-dependent methyltransferase [Magnetococcales bacterium]
MFVKFWIKTLALRLPFYHTRQMLAWQQLLDPGYNHERDKHPVRQKHHGQGGWQSSSSGGITTRDYADYDEYLTHQKTKWDEILKVKGGLDRKVLAGYRRTFFRRFAPLCELLPPEATILCLGARQGTEVEVLRDIGFHDAWGIDLNPGPDNPFVKPGDFMHLQEADESLDLIYSNCVDHAFDLDAFFREHARALKPNGLALYDLSLGSPGASSMGGPFEAVSWENEEVIFQMMLKHYRSVLKVEREPGWMWVLLRGKTTSPHPANHAG